VKTHVVAADAALAARARPDGLAARVCARARAPDTAAPAALTAWQRDALCLHLRRATSTFAAALLLLLRLRRWL
jgi:hypothetical protein